MPHFSPNFGGTLHYELCVVTEVFTHEAATLGVQEDFGVFSRTRGAEVIHNRSRVLERAGGVSLKVGAMCLATARVEHLP